MKKFGLSLAFWLYFLLISICLPAFMLYYFISLRAIENLHDRQVEFMAKLCSSRLEEWVARNAPNPTSQQTRDALQRELRRFVDETNGMDSLTLFLQSEAEGLKYLSGYGRYAALSPSAEDRLAALNQNKASTDIFHDGEHYLAISLPLRIQGKTAGAIHLEVSPENLTASIPNLRNSMILGAIALLLVMGVSVVAFFHFLVWKPIRGLIQSMNTAAKGNLNDVVRFRGVEFGMLGYWYNQMMLRLRSSRDQNQQLIARIQGFNQELQQKIGQATKQVASKNTQLQAANKKLYSIQRRITVLERLASLGQISSVLAHELGTPLNLIYGHLQLLYEEDLNNDRATGRLKVIESQVERLIKIVRDVLETMRMPPPRFQRVQISEIIRGVAELIAPAAQVKNIVLDMQLDAGLPMMLGDPGQLEQLFMNLFTNAMDAMNSGGTLAVSAGPSDGARPAEFLPEAAYPAREGGFIRVEVSDTGEGMEEETARQAFEPFFSTKRAEKTLKNKSPSGLGLGLSICRQIVKNHRGEITFVTKSGTGTCFQILFPLEAGKTAAIP